MKLKITINIICILFALATYVAITFFRRVYSPDLLFILNILILILYVISKNTGTAE